MSERYEFGAFVLDAEAGKLWQDDEEIALPSRVLDTLTVLVRHHGQLVEKDQLIKAVWSGAFVSDDSLVHSVSVLRRALGDMSENPRYVATVPRRGYRFIAEVVQVGNEPSPVLDSPIGLLPAAAASSSPGRATAGNWQVLALAISAAALALAITVAILFVRPASSALTNAEQRIRFSQRAPEGTNLVSGGVLSPDGRKLAFVAREQASAVSRIWIRALDSETPIVVPGTESASKPFWSPDSEKLAYFADDKLKVIDLRGEAPKTIAAVTVSPTGGTWNQDDEIIFGDSGTGLSLVPAAGGHITTLTTLRPSEDAAHAWPSFLPDGRHFVFTILSWDPARAGIWVQSTDGGGLHRVVSTSSPAVYAPPGFLLYVEKDNLLAATFDLARLTIGGETLAIGQSVSTPRVVDGAAFSVSGALLSVRTGKKSQRFVWYARDGRELDDVLGPTPLFNPTLSPDGRLLAATGSPTREPGLWLVDLAGKASTRLAPDAIGPAWSPDGRHVAFTTRGGLEIHVRDMSGSDTDALLLRDDRRKVLQDWSADGRYVVYTVFNAGGNLDLWRVSVTDPTHPVPLLATPANERQARVSPDGRWFAYASDESGQTQVYIQRFPGLGTKRAVSSSGGAAPFWSGSGNELFYVSNDRTLRSVTVRLGDVPSVGPEQVLFRVPLSSEISEARNLYVPAVNGERFLFNVTEESREHGAINLVINWRAQLRSPHALALNSAPGIPSYYR